MKKAKEPVTDHSRGFAFGVALCAGVLVKFHDQPSMAQHLLIESGLEVKDLKRYDVDSYDINILRKARLK